MTIIENEYSKMLKNVEDWTKDTYLIYYMLLLSLD